MRIFAFVVLLALALLPKTGWVVRSHGDLLAGGWGSLGQEYGWENSVGPVPHWASERENLRDPAARLLANPASEPLTPQQRWRLTQAALADPGLRGRLRGPALQRTFTATIVPLDRPVSEEKRAFARGLLPLALEGEAAERDNAFYPSCAWMLYVLLDQPKEARAALARAARCPRYTDATFEEIDAFMKGFEGQYGYRGSLVRLIEHAKVWLPHFTALRNNADLLDRAAPLADASRGDLARLGVTMVRTSPTLIGMVYGRALFLRAIRARRDDDPAAAYAAFRKANPGFRDNGSLEVVRRVRDTDEFIDPSMLPLSPVVAPVAATLLLGLVGALASAWPKREVDEAFAARLRSASWAWLGLGPVALFDGRDWATSTFWTFVGLAATVAVLGRQRVRPAMVVGGVACALGLALCRWGWALPPALWLAAVALPVRLRPAAWAVAIPLAAAAATYWALTTSHGWTPLAGFAIVMASLRLALPARRRLAWLPAVLATLYVFGVVAELRADAQVAEVVRQLQTEAERFRGERGI